MATTLLHGLTNPPISEVVCSIIFDSVEPLDTILLGLYWGSIRNHYTSKRVSLPFLSEDQNPFNSFDASLSAWFKSLDESHILRFQNNRMTSNWRSTEEKPYPRFLGQDSSPGILTKTLDEYERFRIFVKSETGVDLFPKKMELSKVNLIESGVYWEKADDLLEIFPQLQPFLKGSFAFDLRWGHEQDDYDIDHRVLSGVNTSTNTPVLQFDIQVSHEINTTEPLAMHGLFERFKHANELANNAFLAVISESGIHRFSQT